jgi:hypothetical protein
MMASSSWTNAGAVRAAMADRGLFIGCMPVDRIDVFAPVIHINPINRHAANEQPAIGHGRPDSPGIGRGANSSEILILPGRHHQNIQEDEAIIARPRIELHPEDHVYRAPFY